MYKRYFFSGVFILSFILAPLTHAQTYAENIGLENRIFGFLEHKLPQNTLGRDAYTSSKNGREIGAGIFTAGLRVDHVYDDNVLETTDDARDDFVTVIQPQIGYYKPIERHDITASLRGEINRNINERDQNTVNYAGSLKGTLEAYQNLYVPISVSYARDVRENNNRALSAITEKPIAFKTFAMSAGAVYHPNRIKFETTLSHRRTRIDDGTLRDSGNREVNRDGDTDTYGWITQATYDTRRTFKPFIRATYEHQDYVRPDFQNGSFSGPERDTNLLRGLLGTAINYKNLVFGELAIGRERRNYNDSAIDDEDNNALEMTLSWKPREKILLGVELSDFSREDNLIQTGTDDFSAGLFGRYELQNDLFFNAQAGWRERDFTSIN